MKFVIWSFEYDAWWAPNERGYVTDLVQAARYNDVDAGRIVVQSVWLEEIAVAESIAIGHGPPRYHPYYGCHESD